MTRDEFMKKLAYLLQDVPEEDRLDAIQYYNDYFDEGSPEKEDAIIRELGSPERIAAIIRADIAGHLKEGGEFTDSGYQDERYRDPNFQLAKRLDLPEAPDGTAQTGWPSSDTDGWTAGSKERTQDSQYAPNGSGRSRPPRTSRVLKIILWIILILVAGPILLGIGSSIMGIFWGTLGVLIALIITLGILTAAALLAGIIMIPIGIFHLLISPLNGALTVGTGMIALGAGSLLLALSLLFYGTFLPFLFRSIIDFISRLLHRRRRVYEKAD